MKTIQQKLAHLDRVAQLMDAKFSFFGFKFGLDSLIGLIPGLGDIATAFVSAYIVYNAYSLGVPRNVLWRMIGNVAADFVIGSIPLAGDIADVFWQANLKNMELLHGYFENM